MLAINHFEYGDRHHTLLKAASPMRVLPLFLAATIYLALVAGPAMAENAALNVANAALKGGKFSFVVKTIDKALKSGSLDTKDMSRALLYRGLAFQSLNKSAQSIADLTNAIWMGGLTNSEKAEALKYRARAFNAGGVTTRANTDSADAARLSKGLPTGESLVGAPAKPLRTAAKSKGGFGSGITNGMSGISDFFGNIIPGSSTAKKKPAIAPTVPSVPTVVAMAPTAIAVAKVATNVAVQPSSAPSISGTRSTASIAASKARNAARLVAARRKGPLKATPSTSGWATAVNQVPAASVPAKKTSTSGGSGFGGVTDFFGNIFGGSSTAKPAPPAPSRPVASYPPTRTAALDVKKAAPAGAPRPTQQVASRSQGRYKLQVATVRSKDEANTILTSLGARFGTIIAKHPARIDEAVVGNMGTFYRVRLEAFDSKKTALKTCNKLRASGLDCFPVAR